MCSSDLKNSVKSGTKQLSEILGQIYNIEDKKNTLNEKCPVIDFLFNKNIFSNGGHSKKRIRIYTIKSFLTIESTQYRKGKSVPQVDCILNKTLISTYGTTFEKKTNINTIKIDILF